MTEITNTPDLRFPEFNDKWQRMNLSNIVTTIKGNDNQIDLPILTISAKYGWLTQKERFSQVIAGNSLKRYTKVSRGDLSYNKGNSKIAKYGIVYKMNYDEALVPNVYKSFRPHKGINSSFIEKYFHTKKLDRQLRKYISSTARMDGLLNISDNDFYKVNIYIPNSFEQEKIGDFFNKLDQQIELEEKKLELLEQQKRGYMQQIFSQDLRFKDENGDDYPDWKETTIKEIAEIKTGSKDTKDAREDGNYNFYVRSPIIHKINSYSYDGEAILTVGDGVGVGKVFHYVNGKFDYHQRVYKISDFKNYYGLLLYYYFSKNFLKEATKYNAKTSVDSVRKDMIANMKVPMPIMEEQQKIGDFLVKIDKLIENQSKKIDFLKQRKQGLLQKMFV